MKPQTDVTSDWIMRSRPSRNVVDTTRPYAFVFERERAAGGENVDVATIFLTNRECPWKCLMCDLWKNTTVTSVAEGAIPDQIEFALKELGPRISESPQIKLYNSGSFFDPRAIPVADHPKTAKLLQPFNRVVVECHPALISDRVMAFRDMLGETKLEVAMGLETADPNVLEKLNKGITLDSFRKAAGFLKANAIDLRVFILVKPPWQSEADAIDWAIRSVEFAIECHATVAALIPTRFGNGALEELAKRGEFSPPQLSSLETAFDRSLKLACDQERSIRIFADLWDLGQFSECNACFESRRNRLQRMNDSQRIESLVECERCGL